MTLFDHCDIVIPWTDSGQYQIQEQDKFIIQIQGSEWLLELKT
jgi:hypothetical protein